MQRLQGKAVSHGIAMGPVVVWQKENVIAEKVQIGNVEDEVARLDAAYELSKKQLEELSCRISCAEDSPAEVTIFQAHQMLLEDEGFIGRVRQLILTGQRNAEVAVEQVGEELAGMFVAMEDVYMRERAVDIRDVAERMMQNLQGMKKCPPKLTEPSIVVAKELTPSETVQFDKDKVLAFVTEKGSYYSHAAILARSMGIPALVGVNVKAVKAEMTWEKAEEMVAECKCAVLGKDGSRVIIDTKTEELILAPDEATTEEYLMKMKRTQEAIACAQEDLRAVNATVDEDRIHICANVGSVEEAQDALLKGADGIGLFRSEFLFLGKTDAPSEEEQYLAYKQVLETMGDRQVIIRTLDVGADKQATYLRMKTAEGKQVSYVGWEAEANPAMGCRGIRFCLKEHDIFRMQLRALLRAAVYGNLAMMYPMITSMEEVEQVLQIVNEVAAELEEQGIAYKIPPQGIMIETPAAVMISDELAEAVDFCSIGTNDLTQYTLAMDRENGALEEFYRPHHKAVLRMIQMVVENVHKAGKKVGICGELAADIALTESFVCMGVDELSVAPGRMAEIRRKVWKIRTQE